MTRFVIILLTILFAHDINAQGNFVQTFDRYPAKVLKIKSKAPNLKSHKLARMFRTNLRDAANEGINFAGHFVLTVWGCGASCGVGAIINARSGVVYFPEELTGMSNAGILQFRSNSQLIILDGGAGNGETQKPRKDGTHYFRWTGKKLQRIKFVKRVG